MTRWGILVPLLRRRLDQDTRRGFTEMNAALKLLAECNERGGTISILYGER
jgi:hypothetical protein